MKLTEEQIAAIMVKDGKSKTILVENNEAEKIVGDYQKDGWKLVKKSEINGRTKLTFVK